MFTWQIHDDIWQNRILHSTSPKLLGFQKIGVNFHPNTVQSYAQNLIIDFGVIAIRHHQNRQAVRRPKSTKPKKMKLKEKKEKKEEYKRCVEDNSLLPFGGFSFHLAKAGKPLSSISLSSFHPTAIVVSLSTPQK